MIYIHVMIGIVFISIIIRATMMVFGSLRRVKQSTKMIASYPILVEVIVK